MQFRWQMIGVHKMMPRTYRGLRDKCYELCVTRCVADLTRTDSGAVSEHGTGQAQLHLFTSHRVQQFQQQPVGISLLYVKSFKESQTHCRANELFFPPF